MQFALMIYQPHPFDASRYSPEEYREIAAGYAALNATAGVTPGVPLGAVAKAVTVRVEGGKPRHEPSPYAGPAIAVGGYLLLEVPSLEDALALAARVPAARLGGAVEVRPCEVYW
jgi:hypothetical protein